MKNKMYLISGILTSVVFVTLIIDLATGSRSISQIKLKDILYLVGWLLLSIVLLHEYFKNIKS